MKRGLKARPELLKNDRLLLLEEGHCLRDHALAFCQLRHIDHIDTFGASSLSTIVQMVANGMGVALLLEISIEIEAKHRQIQLMRFADPQPSPIVGLAWRASVPAQARLRRIWQAHWQRHGNEYANSTSHMLSLIF